MTFPRFPTQNQKYVDTWEFAFFPDEESALASRPSLLDAGKEVFSDFAVKAGALAYRSKVNVPNAFDLPTAGGSFAGLGGNPVTGYPDISANCVGKEKGCDRSLGVDGDRSCWMMGNAAILELDFDGDGGESDSDNRETFNAGGRDSWAKCCAAPTRALPGKTSERSGSGVSNGSRPKAPGVAHKRGVRVCMSRTWTPASSRGCVSTPAYSAARCGWTGW